MLSAAQGTGAQVPLGLACFRLSARLQGRRFLRAFGRLGQKNRWGNAKRVRQRRQGIGGHVFRAALNTTDIRAVDLGSQRQSLLRHAALNAVLAEVPANNLAHVHCAQEGSTNGLTIDGLIVPYFDLRGLHDSCACLGGMK